MIFALKWERAFWKVKCNKSYLKNRHSVVFRGSEYAIMFVYVNEYAYAM